MWTRDLGVTAALAGTLGATEAVRADTGVSGTDKDGGGCGCDSSADGRGAVGGLALLAAVALRRRRSAP